MKGSVIVLSLVLLLSACTQLGSGVTVGSDASPGEVAKAFFQNFFGGDAVGVAAASSSSYREKALSDLSNYVSSGWRVSFTSLD
ncbi:hypothetical protein HYS54_04545, partial [Candidatus Micrarchaeota archaeon]|nr:hypothetical protein [Candidatus Micrarchaeota archaeon]